MPNATTLTLDSRIKPSDRIALAPMEGVVDYHVRQLLSEIGGISFCVTEFLRVTNQLQPDKAFKKICPEIQHDCQTSHNTPVHLQLLGNNIELLAAHAAKAANMGAKVIDLNFGCPAKTVNRHKGGAVLLQYPEEIHQIVQAVSNALKDSEAQLTAKMRLGYEDKSLAFENMAAIEAGGAKELTVHARTKVEGYKPPAHWQWLARLKEKAQIPIIANGEVWNIEDYHACRDISGCKDVMIGRGLLADPYLGHRIRYNIKQTPTLADLTVVLYRYLKATEQSFPEKFLLSRSKQWLGMMNKNNPDVQALFDQVRVCNNSQDVFNLLFQSSQQERHFAHCLTLN